MFVRRMGNPGLWMGVAALGLSGGAFGQTLTTLHNFTGVPHDGQVPMAGVVMDANGNLFGTTYYGGKGYHCEGSTQGCGVVFKIAPDGTETLLTEFVHAGKEGSQPRGGLIVDGSGNLYGTTAYGGKCDYLGGSGCGTVFEIATDGTETVLHDFGKKKKDGQLPLATLTRDAAGNLYGTTESGGAHSQGTVFKLAPDGSETILYSFCKQSGCADGKEPVGGVILDQSGDLYGTTGLGGDANCNCGVAFELSASGKETVLHAFLGANDGATPYAGLTMDASGDLYGTTLKGGSGGYGTVFEIPAGGGESVLHAFTGGTDGGLPYAGLVADSSGNVYGAASTGGANNKGVIFEIPSGGGETVLYNFCSLAHCDDGWTPYGSLIEDANGDLYGTTTLGGVNIPGTVFELAR